MLHLTAAPCRWGQGWCRAKPLKSPPPPLAAPWKKSKSVWHLQREQGRLLEHACAWHLGIAARISKGGSLNKRRTGVPGGSVPASLGLHRGKCWVEVLETPLCTNVSQSGCSKYICVGAGVSVLLWWDKMTSVLQATILRLLNRNVKAYFYSQ